MGKYSAFYTIFRLFLAENYFYKIILLFKKYVIGDLETCDGRRVNVVECTIFNIRTMNSVLIISEMITEVNSS